MRSLSRKEPQGCPALLLRLEWSSWHHPKLCNWLEGRWKNRCRLVSKEGFWRELSNGFSKRRIGKVRLWLWLRKGHREWSRIEKRGGRRESWGPEIWGGAYGWTLCWRRWCESLWSGGFWPSLASGWCGLGWGRGCKLRGASLLCGWNPYFSHDWKWGQWIVLVIEMGFVLLNLWSKKEVWTSFNPASSFNSVVTKKSYYVIYFSKFLYIFFHWKM